MNRYYDYVIQFYTNKHFLGLFGIDLSILLSIRLVIGLSPVSHLFEGLDTKYEPKY